MLSLLLLLQPQRLRPSCLALPSSDARVTLPLPPSTPGRRGRPPIGATTHQGAADALSFNGAVAAAANNAATRLAGEASTAAVRWRQRGCRPVAPAKGLTRAVCAVTAVAGFAANASVPAVTFGGPAAGAGGRVPQWLWRWLLRPPTDVTVHWPWRRRCVAWCPFVTTRPRGSSALRQHLARHRANECATADVVTTAPGRQQWRRVARLFDQTSPC